MASKNPEKTPVFAYIRWSSDKQSDGHSRQRQLEMAQEYVSRHGLELRKEHILIDEGISAFTGSNITSGKLGWFLDQVKDKKITRNTVFLIEGFDRLSRQTPFKAFRIFSEILEGGIKLVTLNDGRQYSENSKQLDEIFLPMLHLSTSNQESEKKQARLRSVWAEKRSRAGSQKATRMAPGWLKAVGTGKDFLFKPIPERVAVVKFIFEQCVAGIGNYTICATLNARGTPTFQKSKHGDGTWQTGSVQRILSNRAVLGEMQPCKRINKRQVPEGPPIKEYFPQIIDENLFDKAASARRSRLCRDKNGQKRPRGGRKGENLPNLFTGIPVRCLYCGSAMYYRDKRLIGNASFGCSKISRGLGCESKRWNYGHFEESFLRHVEELGLEKLNRSANEVSLRSELQNEVENLQAQYSKIVGQMENLIDAAATVPMVAKRLEELDKVRAELAHTISAKEDQIAGLNATAKAFYASQTGITALVHKLQGKGVSGDDLFRLRAQVSSTLKSLVASIHLAVVGCEREFDAPIAGQAIYPERFFIILFTNGESRTISPSSDPIRAETIWSSAPLE
jgi:DNA invertase Pin-like site-specific DNA recombinase